MKQTMIFTCILCIALAALVGCTQAPVESNTEPTGPIKVGYLGPLTGDMAEVGKHPKYAVELAVEEINAQGGINGRTIEVIYEDGKCTGKTATNAGQKLMNVDGVKYILGGLCSSETLAIAPTAEQTNTVVISTCSSSPDVTDAGDFIFRTYPNDLYQGQFAAEYVFNDLGYTKVAVMNCLSDYCVAITDVFMSAFEELGGEIVIHEEFPQGSSDLRTELTKVKDAEPELIYFIAYTESFISGVKQVEELGIETRFLSGDTGGDQSIWENSKGFSDGHQYILFKAEGTEEYRNTFTAQFEDGDPTSVCTPQAYDAAKILAKAIEEAGDSRHAVKAALYNMETFEGVSGPIKFDSNGDLSSVGGYVVYTVKDGAGVLE